MCPCDREIDMLLMELFEIKLFKFTENDLYSKNILARFWLNITVMLSETAIREEFNDLDLFESSKLDKHN